MNYILSEDKIISIFLDIAKISSPSFLEKPIFDYIENYLQNKKVQIKRIHYHDDIKNESSDNMIIKIPATNIQKKGLFFDAHADTVYPCENIMPLIKDGIIKSSGNSILGGDDKAGIASILCAIDMILENNIDHGELVFIISSAEEVGLIGARYIPKEELKGTKFGIILDGGGAVGKINLQAPFHYEYKITIIGKASHAGIAPEKGINAIKIAADLIQELPSGRISEDTVCNIGLINGGSGRNVVPEKVVIIGEIRSLFDEKCDPIKNQIYEIIDNHKDKAINIECDIILSNVGYNFTKDSPLIKFISQGLQNIGITPEYESSCGGTNANIYATKGIESTVISVGMEEIHGINEYIRIKDLMDTTKLIIQLIKQA